MNIYNIYRLQVLRSRKVVKKYNRAYQKSAFYSTPKLSKKYITEENL